MPEKGLDGPAVRFESRPPCTADYVLQSLDGARGWLQISLEGGPSEQRSKRNLASSANARRRMEPKLRCLPRGPLAFVRQDRGSPGTNSADANRRSRATGGGFTRVDLAHRDPGRHLRH